MSNATWGWVLAARHELLTPLFLDLALLFALRALAKVALASTSLPGEVADFLRYALIGAAAGGLLPALFVAVGYLEKGRERRPAPDRGVGSGRELEPNAPRPARGDGPP